MNGSSVTIPDLSSSSDSDDDDPSGGLPSLVFQRTDAWDADLGTARSSSRTSSRASPDRPLADGGGASPTAPFTYRPATASPVSAHPEVEDEAVAAAAPAPGDGTATLRASMDVGLSAFLTESRGDDSTYQAAHHPSYAAIAVATAGDARPDTQPSFGPPTDGSLPAAFPPRAWVSSTGGDRKHGAHSKTRPALKRLPRRSSADGLRSPPRPTSSPPPRASSILRGFLPSTLRRQIEATESVEVQELEQVASAVLDNSGGLPQPPAKRPTPHDVRLSRVRSRGTSAAALRRRSSAPTHESTSAHAALEAAAEAAPASATMAAPAAAGPSMVPAPPKVTPPSQRKDGRTKSQVRRQQRANSKAKREKAATEMAFRSGVSRAIHSRHPNADLLFDSDGSFGEPPRQLPDATSTSGGSPITTVRLALSGLTELESIRLVSSLLARHQGSVNDTAAVMLPYSVASVAQVIVHGKRALVVHFRTTDTVAEVRRALRRVKLPGLPHALGNLLLATPSMAEMSALQTPASCWYHASGTDPKSQVASPGNRPQTSVSLLPPSTFAVPKRLLGILERATAEQFDLVGLRLVYITLDDLQALGGDTIADSPDEDTESRDSGSGEDILEAEGGAPPQKLLPILAIALRRASAIATWHAVVGPQDPTIARRTDPRSIRALYGKERNDVLLSCSRTPAQARFQLTVCFGRRFPLSTGTDADPSSLLAAPSVHYLATSPVQVVAVVVEASLVLPAVGQWWSYFSGAGFIITGLGRARMDKDDLLSLNFPSTFSGRSGTVAAGFVWIMSKERAGYFARAIADRAVAAVVGPADLDAKVHVVSDRRGIDRLVGCITELPSPEASSRRLSCTANFVPRWHPELPHCVILTVLPPLLHRLGGWLQQLAAGDEASACPLRVIGVKWLPEVRQFHAKELTPYEVGDAEYRPSVARLASSQLLLLAIHGVRAHERVQKLSADAHFLEGTSCMLSATPTIAWRQLSVFFLDREVRIGADLNGKCLRPIDTKRRPFLLNIAPVVEPITTMVVIKPQCRPAHVMRTLRAIQRAGFAFIYLDLRMLSDDVVAEVLRTSPSEFPGATESAAMTERYVESMTAGRCWVLGIERPNAVAAWRGIMGPADPAAAKKADEFSLRAIFAGSGAVNNELFASESFDSAMTEASLLQRSGRYMLNGAARVDGSLRSSLVETTGVIVTAAVLESMTVPQVLECLNDWGFAVLAASLRTLSTADADSLIAAKSAGGGHCDIVHSQRMRSALTAGVSLVLALERENAVTCGEMLLAKDAFKPHFGVHVFASETQRSAEAELRLLFPLC